MKLYLRIIVGIPQASTEGAIKCTDSQAAAKAFRFQHLNCKLVGEYLDKLDTIDQYNKVFAFFRFQIIFR